MPAGRPKGALNKVTRDLKLLAQKHTPAALKTLVSVMQASDSDAARVAAARELLDRGYGKAHQSGELKIETTKYVVEVPATVPTAEWEKRFTPPVQH